MSQAGQFVLILKSDTRQFTEALQRLATQPVDNPVDKPVDNGAGLRIQPVDIAGAFDV